MTPLVRILLAANVGTFVLQVLADRLFPFTTWFALTPLKVAQGAVWQVATYLFLHGGVWHLLMNMLALFMFGSAVEARMGTRAFAGLYFTAGLGAGLVSLAAGWGQPVSVVGASGAIFGVLLAYAVFYPYRPITLLVFFVLPVTLPARVLVAGYAVVEALFLLSTGGLGHLAHLSGLAFGWGYLRAPEWAARARDRIRRRRVNRQMRIVTRARAEERTLQEEMDRLLDTISRKGMAGLTPEEKRRLVEASERLKKL